MRAAPNGGASGAAARLFAFWALFANEHQRVAGGEALASPPVPLLFANATWNPDLDRLDEVVRWHESRGAPAAIVLPCTPDLRADAQQAGLTPAERLSLVQADGGPANGRDGNVEQIGWMHVRPVAERFARTYDRMDVEIELASCLASAMQREARVDAWLAYRSGDEAGAGISLRGKGATIAWLEGDLAPAVAARLTSESPETGVELLELSPPDAACQAGAVERWLVPVE